MIMTPRLLLLGAAMAMAAACSSAGGDTSTAPTGSPTTSPPAETTTTGEETGAGGFDFDRVLLMEPEDLPDGIPVPVPFGGAIDDSLGAFEGELLVVDYDPRFSATAAAFYAAWFEMEGLQASRLIASGGGQATGWELTVDGIPVRIELNVLDDGSASRLWIYWG